MKVDLDPADCLGPTFFINSDHASVVECLAKLDVGKLSAREKAVRIFEFVRDKIEYEFRAKLEREKYVASGILRDRRGFCVQKAVVQCALGRAAGIPTALVMVSLRDHTLPRRIVEAMRTDTLNYHGLGAFYLEGRWLRADATLSPALVKRKGYRLVEFDGREEAIFSPTTLAGKPHGEYVRWIGAYADLPIDDMLADFHRFWQTADMEALQRARF